VEKGVTTKRQKFRERIGKFIERIILDWIKTEKERRKQHHGGLGPRRRQRSSHVSKFVGVWVRLGRYISHWGGGNKAGEGGYRLVVSGKVPEI